MNDKKIKTFLTGIFSDYVVFAPSKIDGKLTVKEVKNQENIDWSGQVPENSWKRVFFPAKEQLFVASGDNLTENKNIYPKTVAMGINVIDLRAFTLYEKVFADDLYYQKRRRNTLVVGYSPDWPIDYKKYKIFSHNFEDNVLEHLIFDVFIVNLKGDNFSFYTGSKDGQRALEKYGITDYKNIEYAGSTPKTLSDKKMLQLQMKITKSADKRIWHELGKICLACGKCSVACPTCFCFDLEDRVDPENPGRIRKWGNCFYNDFSRVAGGYKPLDSVKEKIYFWYVHKFVRIPREYKMPGCVSCGRCTKVCPVGININKVIANISKIN
ncbi:MAG: 4Fe-4S dicluster domain-containing protein [Patescibacteria group bacterium]|jgi:ferredoxin